MKARLAWAALAALALATRIHGLHKGLIYPDGYQYLLMAKGIAAHLTPTLQLGRGGELFVPSLDASLKPLFPALVALVSQAVSLRTAADAVTAVSGAATVVLVAALAYRLTQSTVAAAFAAACALLSPTLSYWSGFAGPDALASALALATVLAATNKRATLAGVLGGLCAATRPEWLLVLAPAAAVALTNATTRERGGRSLTTGTLTVAAIWGVLRPPLAPPHGGLALLAGALGASLVLQLGAAWAARTTARATAAAFATGALIAVAAASGRSHALTATISHNWPLLLAAGAGLVLACRGRDAHLALGLLAAAIVLGAGYAYRNPGSERYIAQLIGPLTVAAGYGAANARLPARARIAIATAAAAALALLTATTAAPGPDAFQSLATSLAKAPAGTLVSAAPDAFAVLLPGRAEQQLTPGARGLVLLDPAQRVYDPELTAVGTTLARINTPNGFVRPNGTLDLAPAILVRGAVTTHR
jgi:hypothetical protein